ncbi:MAG: transaldolase [Bauldia sp.]|nr:transaldolase [Bauldia sp.]
MPTLGALRRIGQSVWLDDISRPLIASGALARLIGEGLAGVTSNPTIVHRAVSGSDAYEPEIRELAAQGLAPRAIAERLAMADVAAAADLFHPAFDRSGGEDGFVSIEVSPRLADDADATVAEGKRLSAALARPNIFIKVPATRAGLSAIRRLTAAGISVNVTLIFGLDRYQQVAEAYIAGLEDRVAAGQSLAGLRSVASFFISRIDDHVDRRIADRGEGDTLRGKAAISLAHLAYARLQALLESPRWQALASSGAAPQRLLWASMGVKDDAYPDTRYVEALALPGTIATLPRKTLDAFLNHGRVEAAVTADAAAAAAALAGLAAIGIDLAEIDETLVKEGVEKFAMSEDALIAAVADVANGAAGSLADDELAAIDAWWRAANYLSVGQIYLLDNPLLREPLKPEHVKPRLLGHWGTSPGLSFIYAHLNRIIRARDLDVLYITGPGHGGPALVAATYLEGTYSELYPDIGGDEDGLRKLFRQFSFPGGIPSHCAPETPGSIHEGGELGYALSHAFGAAFDNPELIVACVVGDGEAETGPLAASWHGTKFLNPATDGAVLPILHLNGYKIANPTVLARIGRDELADLMRGNGYAPVFVEGDEPAMMHRAMADALDRAVTTIRAIQAKARAGGEPERPAWPMIVLVTPKGWTGPKEVDGLPTEGTWRSHQVPFGEVRTNPGHLKLLEDWLRSYRPHELFDEAGALRPELRRLAPDGDRRMGMTPHANGGLLLQDLVLPAVEDHAVAVPAPGVTMFESTRVVGTFLRDVMRLNADRRNFRVFGPDETASNRLGALFEVTARTWLAERLPGDDHLAPDGRVMEILSEHTCQGWLEGYLLTGRHGFFSTYEAFAHIVDSMFNQHAKWLDVSREVAWRKPVASLNYLLTSHVWRQDHNGFSHQDPGFIDLVMNKKPEVVRVYLPPDANTLVVTLDHVLRTRHVVNVIVAGKQPEPQWLSLDEARRHFAAGVGIFDFASNDAGGEPDIVMACAGDVPTMETLAAVAILRAMIPDLKIRVVNVVDLMRLRPQEDHPHGLADDAFDRLFTTGRPILFAYHGYPWLIHRLTYRRRNHGNLHVRGYREEGTTTTPLDMAVLNGLDRFSLVKDVIERVPGLKERAAHVPGAMDEKLAEHRRYIRTYGEDLPEVRDWRWPGGR